MNDKTYGQIAFEAYSKERSGKTYDEKPIPTWEELKPEIKQAWNTAGEAVLKDILSFIAPDLLPSK